MLTNHQLSGILPMMEAGQSDALLADIRANGVLAPIVIHEGQILDGRHRYTLAQQLGVECPSIEFTGRDPLAFVISANLARRHLTTKQRAAIAADLATMKVGNPNLAKEPIPSNDGIEATPLSTAQAAKAMSVSTASVERAKATKRADPEAHERAKRGKAASKPKAKAPPKKRYSGYDAAVEEGALASSKSHSSTHELKKRIEDANSGLEFHNPEHEDRLRAALRGYVAQKNPERAKHAQDARGEEIRQDVATLSQTAQQKFDRLLERALESQLQLQRTMYYEELNKAVDAKLPEAAETYKRLSKEATQMINEYKAKRDAIPAQMTPDEYKFLLNVLHPDRAPEDRRAKFAQAFDIVRKLDEYIRIVAKGRA